MADGLLTSIQNALQNQYQTTKRGLGLLVSDPTQFGKEAVARYFPTPEEAAQQRALEQSGGIAMNTPYMDKMFNLAQFQGSIKPTGLLNPNQSAMAEIRKIQSERTPTDLSWANNPMTAEPPRITNALPLEDIVKNAENANVKLDISNKNGVLNISKIVVPKEQRGSGVGSSIMRQLSDYADATGTRLTLSPSVDFGATSVSRLKDFYKRFGFVENKGRNKDFSTRETMYREAQNQGSIKPTGLLGSPKSLTMPDVPTVDQMKQYGRVETVPLSKAVSFQSARNWEKFNAGKGPGDLVAGYGDKPLALRLETGEYVIYDGNHRTDLALQKGKTELPMHVIDVKSYDPAHAGRKPVPDKMSSDELLKLLLGN